MRIREATYKDIATLAIIISKSNQDVAAKFKLTIENSPKHPSFCAETWIEADFARGERYFILENNSEPVACVAYEIPNSTLAYLNRLSVLPGYRRRGIGKYLVQHILSLAKSDDVACVSIGIIGEHTKLQQWYAKQGFEAGDIKRFPHLPFSVRYMSYAVQTD